jgi:hypothetical protein
VAGFDEGQKKPRQPSPVGDLEDLRRDHHRTFAGRHLRHAEDGQSVNQVRYHVAVLAEQGELRSAGERNGANGTEQLYTYAKHPPEHGA